MSYQGPILAIFGPTASGKTHKSVAVAKEIGGEIISSDSRQVYKGMDIGTGKDIDEYKYGDGCEIKHHLIDIRPAGYKYNLQEFLSDFIRADAEIRERDNVPILCGGTGMYLEAALNGLQMPVIPRNEALREKLKNVSLLELEHILENMKKLHNSSDTDTIERAIRQIEIEEYYLTHPEDASKRDKTQTIRRPHVLISLSLDRETRRQRVSERLRYRLANGMIEEIKHLLEHGIKSEDLMYYGLEYKYVTQYVIGELSLAEMEQSLEIAIHQFAKRQMTWIRGMERRGFKVHYLQANMDDMEFAKVCSELLMAEMVFDRECL